LSHLHISNFDKAQTISDNLDVGQLHRVLDSLAKKYCPLISKFQLSYRWSIMQIEYATDIVFSHKRHLQEMYDTLTRTAIHTVKPQNIATFLGKKLHGNYQGEAGNNFNTRIEGTRIKHSMSSTAIKMYDKFGTILRIETTSNDISFFQHYRKVEHRDGTYETKVAHMKKGIYSLVPLQKILFASNRRYIEFISTIDDNHVGVCKLNKISKNVIENNRKYKGFNLFSEEDQQIFLTIVRGEFNIRGFQNKNLRNGLQKKSTSQVCRIIKRLRTHGLIKKIANSYRYSLTIPGRQVVAIGLKLKELVIIPKLATQL
jgi:hypothetical protein